MDNSKIEEIKSTLINENADFRQLSQQHQEYEERLSQLADLNYPSEEEQLEEHNLKIKKLAVKDEMYAMLNSYQA